MQGYTICMEIKKRKEKPKKKKNNINMLKWVSK